MVRQGHLALRVPPVASAGTPTQSLVAQMRRLSLGLSVAACAASEYVHRDDSASYSYDGNRSYSYAGSFSYDDATWRQHGGYCGTDYIGDGECDRACNAAEFRWDDGDCFHDDPGCYVHPTGADYRGNVNVTKSGKPCQAWSEQSPRPHTYISSHYPDSNLGGHNSCRNPSSYDGSESPWCLIDSTDDADPIWDYCDVGPPSATPCAAPNPLKPKTHTQLQLGEWVQDSVYENRYKYFNVTLPPTLVGFQVVVVPITGTPVLYASFETQFPNGHDTTYRQDGEGVEVLYMTSKTFGYCPLSVVASLASSAMIKLVGAASAADTEGNGAKAKGECTLYLSVSAHETSAYHIKVYDTAGTTACSAGCAWVQLGDGECHPQCNNEACFRDLGDCTRNNGTGTGGLTTHCQAACKAEWIDDGYCDAACFNSKCNFDGGDCGGKGCSDGCMKKHRGNGVCDAACNVEACSWDSGDCFHRHGECFTDADGHDYRGTVSHTVSGKVCQRWSEQTPNVHHFDHQKWPKAGLGGHNFCRNPDSSEERPWCYTTDPDGPRFEVCEVGAASQTACPMAPPPPPRKKAHGHIETTADEVVGLIVPENAGRAETLGIGVFIGGGVAALAALAALFGLWKLRGRMAKAGMYSFGAPPSADEEGEDA